MNSNLSQVFPTVAIVGRANVGKSSLFNLMARRKIAVVQDYPGVTRDRIHADLSFGDRKFTLVDTGGLEISPEEELINQVQSQVEIAISEAKLILFMVDVRTGLMPQDLMVADKLRQANKPIFLVVNKVDNDRFSNDVSEFYELGFNELFEISCTQNSGISELIDKIIYSLPETVEEKSQQQSIKIAIVGRPNVGKSSVINSILGDNRMIVNSIPGTTRDAVDISFNHGHVNFKLIDTAGMRRKSTIREELELSSVKRSIKSIRRSDIAWLVVDASGEIAKQEKTIANYIAKHGKASIIVVNKWDLIEKENETFNKFIDRIRRTFPQLNYVPSIFVSALTGKRIKKILDLSLVIHREYSTRIPTPALNKVLSELKNRQPHPRSGKMIPKMKYITQIGIQPPTFLIFANNFRKISRQYEAYIINGIRDRFGFTGTPLKFHYRSSGTTNRK